jgi:lysyl-tRNA synthetase class 2
MSHIIEPKLAKEGAPVAVFDFPVSQASLAQIKDGVAERFEIYYQGIELANGFHELTDAEAQRKRFEKDRAARVAAGMKESAPDEHLLAALRHGLPPCSGVALGIERLLAIAMNHESIASTLAFDISRA